MGDDNSNDTPHNIDDNSINNLGLQPVIRQLTENELRNIIKDTNFSISAESKELGYLKIVLDKDISEQQKCFAYKYNFKKISRDRIVLMIMQWFDDPYGRILNYEFNPETLTYNTWTITSGEDASVISDADNAFTILMSYENWHFEDYNLLAEQDKKSVKISAFYISEALISLNDSRLFSLKGNDYIIVSYGVIYFYSDNYEKLKNIENFIKLITC